MLAVEVSSEEYTLMHHFDIRQSDLPQVRKYSSSNNSKNDSNNNNTLG
jgi:hypothetical protein